MPGYIIHLAEAEWILREFEHRFQDILPEQRAVWEAWKEWFRCGALLPDAVVRGEKRKSHFWREEDCEKIILAPDLEAFDRCYAAACRESIWNVGEHVSCTGAKEGMVWLPDPLLCGYRAHLHLDSCYFTRYFDRCLKFIDENGMPQQLFHKIHAVWIGKSQKVISLEQFFSDEYLYGDYTKLNHTFLQEYQLQISQEPVQQPPYPVCEIAEVPLKNLRNLLDSLAGFLQEGLENPGESLKVFPESGDTMDAFVKEAGRDMLAWMLELANP